MSRTGTPGSACSGVCYTLAQSAAHLGFIPLFLLLLPRRVEAVAAGSAISLMSWILLVGGITASLAHILAGRLSDAWLRRSGSRRLPIAAGLLLLLAAYAMLALARNPAALILAIVAFQLALNLMFSPLGALLVDYFPDSSKGRIASWANAGLPLAGLATSLLAFLFPRDGSGAFIAVALAVAVGTAPLLILWPFPPSTLPTAQQQAPPSPPERAGKWRDFILAWAARLLLQMATAFVMNYFYLFLVQFGSEAQLPDPAQASRRIGDVALLTSLCAVGVALAVGRWSDLRRYRRVPMAVAAGLSALSLALISATANWTTVVIGYVGFQAGLIAFLSIDTALVAQLLSAHSRRGELLGYMNLTNTLPNIAVPGIALATLGGHVALNWPVCFLLAGGAAIASALLVLQIRSVA